MIERSPLVMSIIVGWVTPEGGTHLIQSYNRFSLTAIVLR